MISLTSGTGLQFFKNLILSGPTGYALAVDGANQPHPVLVIGEDTVTIKNLTISGASCASCTGFVAGMLGAGISNAGGVVTLSAVIVTRNDAGHGGEGGGIFNLGTLTLANDTISGNSAGAGGGIFNGGSLNGAQVGRISMTNSLVSGNTARLQGGGIVNLDTITATNSTVSGNIVGNLIDVGTGGAIVNEGGIVTLVSDTVSGNTASSGDVGGIVAYAGTIALQKQTCVNNNTSGGTSSSVPWSPINVSSVFGTVTGLNCGVAHP